MKAKIDELFACIRDANTEFGPVRPGEVRVLMAPEWNFEKYVAAANFSTEVDLYTQTEMEDIATKLKDESGTNADAQGWLILPGSILWGVETPAWGVWAAMNTMPLLFEGAEVCRYTKRQWGSDVMNPHDIQLAEPFLERQNVGNEKRRKKLEKGRIPASLKLDLDDIGGITLGNDQDNALVTTVVPDQHWTIRANNNKTKVFSVTKHGTTMRTTLRSVYAPMYDAAACARIFGTAFNRAAHFHPNHFDYPGTDLRCAVEICADHRGAQAIITHDPAKLKGAGADAGLDLHFIVSCGTPLVEWKNGARTGGLLFHCDGESTGKNKARLVTARNRSLAQVKTAQDNANATLVRPATTVYSDRTRRNKLRFDAAATAARDPGTPGAPTVVKEDVPLKRDDTTTVKLDYVTQLLVAL